jgi:hypothetical protein
MPRPSAQISPAHPLIREYQRSLGAPRGQGVENELGLRRPFENLLADSARLHGWRFAFEYRLGNRSALEWVVDQYRITEDERSGIRSDPNRDDDPQYIVRLVGQVVRVSIGTVRIVRSLPPVFPNGNSGLY